MRGCIAIQEWFYKFYEKENAHTIVMLQGICKQTAQTVWINKDGFEENTWNADVGIYLIWLKGLFSFWEDTTKGATSETNFKSSWQSWKNNYTTNIYLFTVLNMMTMMINNFITPPVESWKEYPAVWNSWRLSGDGSLKLEQGNFAISAVTG